MIEKLYNIKKIKEAHFHNGDKKIPKALTSIPFPSDVFIGRDTQLEELHKKLFDQHKPVVVVNGIGGVGKTTFAQHYVTTFAGEYKHIVWISLLPAGLMESFALNTDLIERLHLKFDEKSDVKQKFAAIMRELEILSDENINLLVIDNADSSQNKFYDELPHSNSWHLLLTSREKLLDNFSKMELDVLGKEEAVKLFREHCTEKLIDEQVNSLVEGIGFHTLTIEIIAKTANEIPGVTFEKLKTAIPDDMRTNIQTGHSGKAIENITTYLRSIFDMSKLSEEEKIILMQFTAMPSISIEYGRLELLLADINEELNIILKKLSDKGWLQREGDNFRMHQLIQRVLLEEFSTREETLKVLIYNVIELLNFNQSTDNPIDKIQWTPFGDSILKIFPDSETFEMSLLQNNLAQVNRTLGEFEKARTMFEKVLERYIKNFKEESFEVSACRSNRALVYRDLGQYKKARDLLEKALESLNKNYKENNPNIAICQTSLGDIYRNLGMYKKARDLLENALESIISFFGDKHPTVADCATNLANVYIDIGEYESARNLLEKALESAIEHFGKSHPSVAVRQSNLGWVYQNLGEYEVACDLLEKALESDIKNFGEKHPFVSHSQLNLALIYKDLAQYKKARDLLEKALESNSKNLGAENPTAAIFQSNLATIYKDLGVFENSRDLVEKARDLLEKALESNIKNFGEQHPDVANNQSKLAAVYRALSEHEQARDLLKKALESNIKNFGKNHPTVAINQTNLGETYRNLGEYEKGLQLHKKALMFNIKHFGKEHPNVAHSQSNLASVYVKFKKIKEAVKLWESAYSIFKNHIGENHPNTKTVKHWLDLYRK